ncbi:MAG: sulfatase-like hydrolase/transferase, partial [Planctomycetia bacterium]|nr:sulfatase-like hydrolase/transferase [Planctomycetia bacterium]
MSRRVLLWSAAAVLCAGLWWFLWPTRRPNLLLVTLDTTRADRLGCYGYTAAQTPALDALAAGGVTFEHAYTVAPITLPSHTTMFTGLYPAENGVVTNGRGRLDDRIPTLADVLRREGYDTGAFVASFVLNRKFGLDRGFNTYDDEFFSEEPAEDALHRQRHAGSVVDAALRWLNLKRDKPFFCWIHLYDPHAPYLSHSDLFGEKFLERPYDAEIAYVDLQMGRLVEFLKTRGLESQTLVAVVGDHGEGLSEHVERTHGMTLYDDTIRVPLIFRFDGRLPAKRRVPGNVSLVDLSPTILDLLGLKDSRKATGQSLKNVLLGSEKAQRPVWGATDDPYLVNGWSPLRSLIEGHWKYIRTTKPELYDLSADPGERQNVLDDVPDVARAMAARMAEFEPQLVPRQAIAVQLSTNERRALEALGYLGGAKHFPAGRAQADLPDVKDMLPYDVIVEDAANLAKAGSVAEAIEQLRQVIHKAPGHANARWFLSGALRDAAEFDEAEKVLRDLLALMADSSQVHYGLGILLMQRGKTAAAAAEFKASIDIDPDNAEAHAGLAQAFLSEGRREDALAHYNAVLEIDPQHVAAYQRRSGLLIQMGRIADAIADCRAALRLSPDLAETHHNLGVLLAESGNVDEGGRHLARAVELSPENPEMRFALGAVRMNQRRFDDAIVHLT